MPADALLVSRIHASDETAWRELIARFEGRLLAFVESRVRDRSAAEDIVQETLIGFLNSVANYDDSRSLETYLFSIAAHKLTDHLRRTGRRPAIPMSVAEAGESSWDVPGSQRAASALYRSDERRGTRSGGDRQVARRGDRSLEGSRRLDEAQVHRAIDRPRFGQQGRGGDVGFKRAASGQLQVRLCRPAEDAAGSARPAC